MASLPLLFLCTLSLALCPPVFLFDHYARLSAPVVTFISLASLSSLSFASQSDLLRALAHDFFPDVSLMKMNGRN